MFERVTEGSVQILNGFPGALGIEMKILTKKMGIS